MKSNYDILGNHIRLIDTRNTDSVTDRVLGINIDKFFMPSVANVIGTDTKYLLPVTQTTVGFLTSFPNCLRMVLPVSCLLTAHFLMMVLS